MTRWHTTLLTLLILSTIVGSVGAYDLRNRSVTPIPTISDVHYATLMNATGIGIENTTTAGNGSFPNLAATGLETTGIVTDLLGPIGMVLLFLLPFGMMFIANRSMKGAAVLGLIGSLLIFAYLPSTYAYAAGICMIISLVAGAYSLFKHP
jgi:hypothetical protein